MNYLSLVLNPPPLTEFLHQEISRLSVHLTIYLTRLYMYMFYFFIKAGQILFLSKFTRIRCSAPVKHLNSQTVQYHTPSRLDWLNIGKPLKPIQLFIHEKIWSFSLAIYSLSLHLIHTHYYLNATRRELSRNVNRKPGLYWNTQTVLWEWIRPTQFCHFKINYLIRGENMMNSSNYTLVAYLSDIHSKFIPCHCCVILANLSF